MSAPSLPARSSKLLCSPWCVLLRLYPFSLLLLFAGPRRAQPPSSCPWWVPVLSSRPSHALHLLISLALLTPFQSERSARGPEFSECVARSSAEALLPGQSPPPGWHKASVSPRPATRPSSAITLSSEPLPARHRVVAWPLPGAAGCHACHLTMTSLQGGTCAFLGLHQDKGCIWHLSCTLECRAPGLELLSQGACWPP